MTADSPRRFPVVLTLFAAVAFAILCGFGTWQLQRLGWKRDLMARMEAAQAAPPRPLAEVLVRAAEGEDVEFVRVAVECAPNALPPSKAMLYGLREGRPTWRPIAPCLIKVGPYGVIAVDRGTIAGETTRPPNISLANPVRVEGVLRRPETPGFVQRAVAARAQDDGIGYFDRVAALATVADRAGAHSPDYMLVAEREDPSAPGVTPAPLPTNISNRHMEYVITWFGLALALAGVYAAMLMKRLRG